MLCSTVVAISSPIIYGRPLSLPWAIRIVGVWGARREWPLSGSALPYSVALASVYPMFDWKAMQYRILSFYWYPQKKRFKGRWTIRSWGGTSFNSTSLTREKVIRKFCLTLKPCSNLVCSKFPIRFNHYQALLWLKAVLKTWLLNQKLCL